MGREDMTVATNREVLLSNRQLHDKIGRMETVWMTRLESVKSYVFDLEGNVIARDVAKRVPGSHSLSEAAKLISSTDSTEKEADLLLIASVLSKATCELQAQGLSSTDATSITSEETDADWQAVWAYALGSELELSSLLRAVMEDSNPAVLIACAKALHAILSCSPNENVFDLQEGTWPGNKSTFTAPVFRRHTKQEDGWIGGGRWKYSVNASELHPITQTLNASSDNDDDKDLPGGEATVTSKDIAAGLIRMGLLTRIQHILEVEQLKAVDEHLLSVVIALSRHSPAAAKAVMRCPRLMDTIIQRFLLTDEDLNLGLRLSHNKAIQLLKILSQASTANCIRFAETGALQVAQCELYQQGYLLPTDPRLGENSFKGICVTVVECLRLWRVCINHQIGIALFPDIYPALCSWLTPLSLKAISSEDADDILTLAQESYSLLERLAWTLPLLHTEGSVHLNWAWNVAVPLVETAFGWLGKDRIAGICKIIDLPTNESQQRDHGLRKKLTGTMAQVFHFLATVCEMFTDSGAEDGGTNGSQTITLPPFVCRLAVLLMTNDLLKSTKGKKSMLSILSSLRSIVDDEEMAMVASSCIHGLVRMVSVVDQLSSRLDEESEPTHLPAQEIEAHKIFANGLVVAIDRELRELLYVVGEEMISNHNLAESFEEDGRGGPAPGLGVGWGRIGGGMFSKNVLHAKGIARLVTELLETLPAKHEAEYEEKSLAATSDLLWRISCGLSVAAIAGPGDSEIIHRICSNLLLHPDTLAHLLQRLDATMKIDTLSGASLAAESSPDTSPKAPNFMYENMSKVLLEHYRKVWLCGKPLKSSHSRRSSKKNVKVKTSLISTKLSTLSEESARLAEERIGVEGLANELVAEWAKQRLPLPSHWIYSPLATNLTGLEESAPECKILADGKFAICHGRETEMEDSIKHGLVWLLGLEVLSQSTMDNQTSPLAAIPVTRKVHALSSLFILGGDVFLDENLKDCILWLQKLFGKLLDSKSVANRGFHNDNFSPLDTQGRNNIIDFEGEIDGSYSTFTATLAKRLSTAPSVDLCFSCQVALYLRQDVAASIRLSVWQTLSDTQSLSLLPPRVECCGDPDAYLFPYEQNEEVIAAYASAWESGAIDAAVANGSMAYELSLHHIAGFLFGKDSATEDCVQSKVAVSIVESSMRKPEQEMLLKLVTYRMMAGEPDINELNRRLGFFQEVCKGHTSLITEVNRLQVHLLGSTHS